MRAASHGFTPRDWQRDAADRLVSMARSGADRALIYGCPGSGKTFGGLFIAVELKRRVGIGPKVVVLTPNLAIKSQWIDRAASIGFELLPLTNINRQLKDDQLALRESGLIMNYQQAIGCRTALGEYCERHKPIVILDEVHHTETAREDRDGNRWGTSVEKAFASAAFKVCMTGTPFRQGDNPIAFVDYNENNEATAQVRYPYADAIKDGVCRPIEFDMFDGDIEWRDNLGRTISADFLAPLNKRLRRQRLRAAISADGMFPRHMLDAGHQKLLQLRAGDGADKRAAGIVVAQDIDHANEVGSLLEKISGRPPVVVHDKIDDSLDLIDRFRDGDDLWIVGVSMISEGVDIPRLRVGVYATNIVAPLYFHQFCGRLSRVMEDRHERSYVYMPADSELEAIAREIERERFHALGEQIRRRITRSEPGVRREIVVEDSAGEIVAKVFGGNRIPISLIEHHRKEINDFRSGHPSRHHFTDAEVIQMLIEFNVIAREAA